MEPMGSTTTQSLIILFLKPQINTDEHRYKSKEQRDDIFHICVYPCSSVVPRILFVNFETTDERRSIWVETVTLSAFIILVYPRLSAVAFFHFAVIGGLRGFQGFARGGEQGEARDDAVGIKAVRVGVRRLLRIGIAAGAGEGERFEMHAGGIQVFIRTAFGVYTVETADDVMADHVNHRFGHGVFCTPGLEGIHALLNHDVVHGLTFLEVRNPGSLFAIERTHLVGAFDCHDRHAVSAGIGLDDDEGFLVDAVFAVFDAHLGQYLIDIIGQAILAFAFFKIDFAAFAKNRIDQPRVQANNVRKFLDDLLIMREVSGLEPLPPTDRHVRDHRLLEVIQNGRQPARQVVVEQREAGIETGYRDLIVLPYQRFERDTPARGQIDGFRFMQIG